MSNEQVTIPAAFWRKLHISEFREIAATSTLNKKQCELLWRMTERQDTPPDGMFIMINVKDLIRSFGKHGWVPEQRKL